MDGRLTGRVAIVTGAGQGAGRGCALALAAEGASVVCVGRTRAPLESVAAQIAAAGGTARVSPADVTGAAARLAVVDDTVAAFGRLDVLVNAAQAPAMRAADLLDVTDAEIAELWTSGPVATLALMRACHPHMKAAGGGSIVNFASGALRRPAHYGVYAGVKAAIETIGVAAAVEWGPDGIRTNTVVPIVESPSLDLDLTAEQRERYRAGIPLGRIGRPEEDVGRAVAFLAGDDAAYVSGNTLRLDGAAWSAR
ncbi:SDR family NAD(P)-dependent oxidoreductase [Blastococcus sp. TF02A-26]|uniref:SDR family NAD(P)-dependent oxidoreductase n=1 Tax=Blastococcus sp. TF02A-26 TaxID=2250577 RepID=UPI000DEB7F14|nr:SDR family oxidoreductase [Blastococcus sp. TF02A-26]RBY87459.1 3-oxoacyl-ACP reductase [Blastococcus sp. TF02A-26]